MADPVKPLDRLRPFTCVNNDEAIVKQKDAPDGLGVPCGCRTPEQFGDMEAEFKTFIDSHLPLPLLKVLDTVDAIAKTAAAAARGAAVAAATALAAAQGLLGGPITSVIAAILGFATAIAAITGFIDSVVDVIRTVLRGFLVRIGRRLALRAVRLAPQWVPVKRGASSARITRDQIVEVEGIATRSYGDPIGAPFAQWHSWLNWSVQVTPEERYRNLLSPAPNPPDSEGAESGERPLMRNGSFEIQWDVGALFEPPGPFEARLQDTQMPDVDGPMTTGDWIWPTAGMYVWASGRWVYDCSRASAGPEPKMLAMMNPPRAIATATWEAVQFPENDTGDQKPSKVPAVRFFFFAARRGGYLSYDSLAERDYEFILDLPPLQTEISPFPIGRTSDFPHNTIVIRPRLLRSRVSLPFAGAKLLDPVVEMIPSDDPAKPPKQVKVTIPKSQLDGAEAAGVILSLGWFDPNLERAATVKRCVVTFSGLDARFTVRDNPATQIRAMFEQEEKALRKEIADKIAGIRILGLSIDDIPKVPNPLKPGTQIDLGGDLKKLVAKMIEDALKGFVDELAKLIGDAAESEEWLLRVGVNGRWESRYFKDLRTGAFALPRPVSFEFFLGPDDLLFFTTSGVEFNPVGDMMREARADRLLTRDGRPFTWNQIVTARGDDLREIVFQYALKTLTGNGASRNPALGLENALLGILDPDFASPDDIPETANPLRMKGVEPQTAQFRRLVRFARARGGQFVYVENPGKDDYQLTLLLQVSKQR